MTTLDFKKGTEVQYSTDGINWVDSIITKTSDKFVWFKGSGFERIAKQTFVNHPSFYRIK